jgi:hypothetical protein
VSLPYLAPSFEYINQLDSTTPKVYSALEPR